MLIKNNSGDQVVRCGQPIADQAYYTIQAIEVYRWQIDEQVISDIALGTLVVNDGFNDLSTVDGINFLRGYYKPNPKTDDNRDIVAINRIPPGFTVYPTSKSDSIVFGGHRAGMKLVFSQAQKTGRFQLLSHWYGIGGKIVWEGADLDDHMDVFLKAPATIGSNVTGDFVKVNLAGPYNMFVPVSAGTGTWSLNLAEKHTGTTVLKCVPVPAPGNTGFFDYDSSANTLTINNGQTGGYNLFDFEVTLFCFASAILGRKQDGAETSIEVTDVVGKLLFNSWVVDFSLTSSKTDIRAGMTVVTAVKGNV
jgi:hypothetical protein